MVTLTVAVVLLSVSGQSRQPADCITLTGQLTEGQPVSLSVTAGALPTPQGAGDLFLHVRRLEDGQTFVRAITAVRPVTFVFSRSGNYAIGLAQRAASGAWPSNSVGTVMAQCNEQRVAIAEESASGFTGVRTHAWVGNQLWLKPLVGTSVFVNKFGGAITVGPDGPRPGRNGWTMTADGRYRGTRGYVGAGVRYVSQDDGDGDPRVRPQIVLGQELPSLRGRPVWITLDIAATSRLRWNLFRVHYSTVLGVRLDLTDDRP
jgi:hypothetical protein